MLCEQPNYQKQNCHLPLSLENNFTLTGTAAIFEEFGREFSIPCLHASAIPFDRSEKKFDLMSARNQFDFMKSVNAHQIEMLELEKEMRSVEKHMDRSPEDVLSDSDDNDEGERQHPESAVGKTAQQKQDDAFKELYNKISTKVQQAVYSNEDGALNTLIEQLGTDMKIINGTRDCYERSIFHCAVEMKNYVLVKILLTIGVNPNSQEGCGATPMTVAVINGDIDMVRLLLDHFAEYKGPLFNLLPTPLEMALAMELTEIVEVFDSLSQVRADQTVILDMVQNIDSSTPDDSRRPGNELNQDMDDEDTPKPYKYKRSNFEGFPTAIVGDVGTCKINRGVRHRNQTAYGWSTEILGDMHAKGHLCEAAFKAHGQGGFQKVVHDVMKRPKLTEEAFKKRKFQEQNLNHIQEGVRYASCAYGFAAVQEFKMSKEFPSDEQLTAALQRFGNHNSLLLEKFISWLENCAKCDANHQYHQQLFSLFGSLLEMFIFACKQGDGIMRETIWVLMLTYLHNWILGITGLKHLSMLSTLLPCGHWLLEAWFGKTCQST